jgi:hypothetical protein
MTLAKWEAIAKDEAYWAAYERKVTASVAPMFTDIYLAGASAALRTPMVKDLLSERGKLAPAKPTKPKRSIPTEAELRRAGATAVRREMAEWAGGIAQTTREALIKTLSDAKKLGHGSRWVWTQMNPFFSASRAKKIAVTETTRFFAAGAMEMYKRLGLEFWVWETVEDGSVCAECTSLASESLDFPFAVGEHSPPPRHTLCRCFPRPASREEVAVALVRVA